MRADTKQLLLLELRSLYGWNRFRHTKDTKARRNYLLMLVLWVLLGIMLAGYVAGSGYALIYLGAADVLVPYLVLLASLIIFVFGIFKAGGVLFSGKGYEILSSMPIRQSVIVGSRFFRMYVEDLVLAVLVMVPSMIVYGCMMWPGLYFYPVMLVGMLLVPLLPLVAAAVVGAVITGISSRMKHRSLVQTLLTIVFVIVVMGGSSGMAMMPEEISLEMLTGLMTMVGGMIGQLYPPALWLGEAAVEGRVSSFLLFAVVSLLVEVVMLGIIGRFYQGICRRLQVNSAKHNYELGTLKGSGMLKALWYREWKRYFASSVYVTNTIVGPIMGCALAGAMLAVNMEEIQAYFPMALDIPALVPLLFGGICAMMPTTSAAISMEGKEFWIMRTLPVSMKQLLDAKLLVNLLMVAPFYVVGEILLTVALKPSLMGLIWQILLPALLILCVAVLGLTVNLKFHRFDWEKAEEVVKQGASSLIGTFAGILLALVCAAAVTLTPVAYGNVVKLVLCLTLAGLTWYLYSRNQKVRIEEL